MREIKFDLESKGLEIGGMQAFDYFHDGSFYLLHAPGVCRPRLSRTDTFLTAV